MIAPTDRELLELAAKAAGLRVRTWDGHTGPMCAIDDDQHGRMWNPLTDDGDALRLAVKLEMLVSVDSAPFNQTNAIIGYKIDLKENHGGDPYAATRRAIVRAAAEIGRAMPC